MRSLMRHTTTLGMVLLLWQGVEGNVRVVATTPDLASIAEAVGGDRVEVRSIAKGYQDPHYVAAKPSYMRMLNRADLLIYIGLELEVGWLPLLIQGARNPRVVLGAAGHLDASEGIQVLEVPSGQVDRSMGDVHPEGNPHYMLDPRNGLVVAETISALLEALAPEDHEVFASNTERYKRDLEGRIRGWEARAEGLSGLRVVTYHKQWEYLTHWLGLEIVDQVEDKPGIPPSPRHIASLVRRMKSEGIRVVICSNTVDPKPAGHLAERAGAQLLVLPTSVGGGPGTKTYADLFDTIVSQIVSAFSGS